MRTVTVSMSGRPSAAGFTLSELVVAMGLGGFVLALLLGFLGRLITEETSLLGRLALDRELAELAAIMRSGIQRAVVPRDARDGRFVLPDGGDCLLFRYRSSGGRTRAGGYRLRSGQVQRRTSADCRSGVCRRCRQGHWASLSDASSWRVTRLVFRLRELASGLVLVEVVIEARRRHPPWVERRLDLRVGPRS